VKPLIDALALVNLLAWVLQVSLFERRGAMVLAGIGAAAVAWLLYPFALDYNLLAVTRLLADPVQVQNLAIVQLVEAGAALWGFAHLVRRHYGERVPAAYEWCAFYPGVTACLSLFYLQIQVFFHATGADFALVGGATAAGAGLGAWLLVAGVRALLPEWEIRAELHGLLRLVAIGLAVAMTVLLARDGRTSTLTIDWPALWAFAALALVLGATGWQWQRRRDSRANAAPALSR